MARNTRARSELQSGNTWNVNSVLRILPGTRGIKHHGTNKNHSNRFSHGFYISVYAIIALGAPVYAEGSTNQTAISSPTAVSSGSAVNQAIQVVNSQYFQQHYGGNVSCQGTTLVVAPFAINGLSAPESHMRSDFGVSMQVSIPLDREGVRECKRRARAATARAIAETDKAQLDYQMVRALKCAELIRGGAFLNPASPYAALCADVIARGSDGVLRTGTGQVVAVTPDPGTQRPSSSSTSSQQPSSQTSGASEPHQTKVSQIPQLPSLQPLPPQQ